jgi:hypothetical protein
MVRMQVQFTEAEVVALRRAAAERNASLSAVVREAVERCVVKRDARADTIARAKAVFGKYESGCGDLAARHDDYFVEAIEG